jgi:epoxyqueuosine reductase
MLCLWNKVSDFYPKYGKLIINSPFQSNMKNPMSGTISKKPALNSVAIKEISCQLGAEVCGIANINRFQQAPEGFHPRDIFPEAQSVIIFGSPFLKGTFLAHSRAPYTMQRNQLLHGMDLLALKLSAKIEEQGYLAVPVPSSDPYEFWDAPRRHGRGILSLKHSAQLAGLGSMGKNTLLVNKKFGNRLWLGGVITNAVLEPDALTKSYCPENCRICLDACPQQALNGITIDQKKCREICFTYTDGGGWLIACKQCRISCPRSMGA